MAYQLVAEVLDHAPADLTLGERSVLLVIAEGARVEHRSCPIDRAALAARAGLSPSGLRSVLRRLRDRGLDPRTPNGRVGADGRPLYAVPGAVVTYRLPDLRPAGEDVAAGGPGSTVDNPPSAADKGGTRRPPAIHKGGTEDREGGHEVPTRGALSDPPPRSREPVDAPAPVHVPAQVPAREPAPAEPSPSAAVDAPPRCPKHCDLPADVRGPGCRDCAELRRAWSARRSQQNRDEIRRRRRCRCCDEFGWRLDAPDAGPAVRCRHPGVAPRGAPRGPDHAAPAPPAPRPTSDDTRNVHA